MANQIPTDRFGNPSAKTGPDYSRLKSTLLAAQAQIGNNPLFQTVLALIDGARTSQGFIEQRFNDNEANHTSAFDQINGINDDLGNTRNNSKFSLSLGNSVAQAVLAGVLTTATFDTIIFDDGLMVDESLLKIRDITLNANGQYLITGKVAISDSIGTLGKYLQNLQIFGEDEDNGFVVFIANDGSFQQLNLPNGYSTYNEADVAVSLSHNRFYVLGDNGIHSILVYDGNGNLLNTVTPSSIDATVDLGQGLYAFDDKLWAAIYGAANGEIWEFDFNGNFIRRVATLIDNATTGYLSARMNFRVYKQYIYFISDARSNGPAVAHHGVYRYDLTVGGNSKVLVDKNPTEVFGFAMSSTGDFLISMGINTVERYNAAGVLKQTYTAAGGSALEGLTFSRDERFFYCGNDNPEVILKFDIQAGTNTTIFSGPSADRALSIGSIDCCLPAVLGLGRIQINLNGIRQFSHNIQSGIFTFSGLIEALRNDIINLEILSNSAINVVPALQLHRVTYITHDKDVGRNVLENSDGTVVVIP